MQTKIEKETEIKRRTYTRKIKKSEINLSVALLHAEGAERVCSHTCKLPILYSDTERDREKRTLRQTERENIAEHGYKNIQTKRE